METKPKFKFKIFERVWLKNDLFPETVYVILERGINQYKKVRYVIRQENAIHTAWIDEENLEKAKNVIQKIKEKITDEEKE